LTDAREALRLIGAAKIAAGIGKDDRSGGQRASISPPHKLRSVRCDRHHDLRSEHGRQRILLINGASVNLLRSKATNADRWIKGLRRRRPSLVVAVALANKTARIAWTVMRREESYRPRAAAA